MKVYKIVPAGTRDTYAAGYSENRFTTIEEAEAAVHTIASATPAEEPGSMVSWWDIIEEEEP